MSSLATSHMLIAAGTEDVQVRLCDISSGAFSHTLSGHRGMMMVYTFNSKRAVALFKLYHNGFVPKCYTTIAILIFNQFVDDINTFLTNRLRG